MPSWIQKLLFNAPNNFPENTCKTLARYQAGCGNQRPPELQIYLSRILKNGSVMKNLYRAQKVMLAAVGMVLATSNALAQNYGSESANANANALTARHNAGAVKASKPVFEKDGTPANDAAMGNAPARSVALPNAPKVKTHGRHVVSLGPVGPKTYQSNAQQEIKELR